MKRAFRLWLNKWYARLDALYLWYDQKMCPHAFRPARVNDKPARVCHICALTQELTPAEFFAEFGERNWQR